jgi:hypothetical protein
MIAREETQFTTFKESAEVGRSSFEDIEELAYALWEARGCPEGSAEEDWLQAERELSASQG